MVATGTQALAFDRPESWAMARAASANLFTGFGPSPTTGLGDFSAGLEAGNIPSLSAADRMVGFNGTAEEDLNKVPVLIRPRIGIGLPASLTLEAGYIPPISMNGARSSLFAAALGRPLVDMGIFRLSLRAFGQTGYILGDFTCPASAVYAGNDMTANPFGCHETSDDRVSINDAGLEVGAALHLAPLHGLEIHAAAAATYMDLKFDVNARYGDVVDTTRLTTNGGAFAGTGGLTLPLAAGFALSGDAFYSPLYVTRPGQAKATEGFFNIRGLLQYRF